jgi:hypothetical protein
MITHMILMDIITIVVVIVVVAIIIVYINMQRRALGSTARELRKEVTIAPMMSGWLRSSRPYVGRLHLSSRCSKSNLSAGFQRTPFVQRSRITRRSLPMLENRSKSFRFQTCYWTWSGTPTCSIRCATRMSVFGLLGDSLTTMMIRSSTAMRLDTSNTSLSAVHVGGCFLAGGPWLFSDVSESPTV